MENMKDLAQLAQEAYNVQNACNLLAVVNSYARALKTLKEIVGSEADTHPISKMWADKIASLTGTQSIGFQEMSSVYDEIDQLRGAK